MTRVKPLMRKPRSLAHFKDIEMVLSTVKKIGRFPAEYRESTPARAHVWRHRAHAYRSALRFNEEAMYGTEPGTGKCEYDDLVFKLSGSVVIIEQRVPEGVLMIDGKPVEFGPIPTADADDEEFDLEQFALDIKAEEDDSE